jgi:hypothetical protein
VRHNNSNGREHAEESGRKFAGHSERDSKNLSERLRQRGIPNAVLFEFDGQVLRDALFARVSD